jgi:hypothetical protein
MKNPISFPLRAINPHRHRRPGTAAPHRVPWPAPGVLVLALLLSAMPARAQDCNNNGIPDNIEVSPPNHQYDFEGNGLDSAGSAHGTVGSNVNFANGPAGLGQAAAFGSGGSVPNGVITVPNAGIGSFGTGDFSITFWVRHVNQDTDSFDGVADANGSRGWEITFLADDSGRLRIRLDTNLGESLQANTTAALADSTWYHVAVTVDRDQTDGLRWYINGVLNSTHNPTGLTGNINPDQDLWIGTRNGGQGLEGRLDRFQIYKRMLTADQVLRLSLKQPLDCNNNGVPDDCEPDCNANGVPDSCDLASNQTIVAWGHNFYGQTNVPAPNSGFVAVAGGFYHSLGLKADGSIVAWGYNGFGQCNVPSPNSGFVAVAGGGLHSLGLKADGSIVAWGHNFYGQTNVPSPNSGFVAVAGGFYHSLGLKADGSIRAWGDNQVGQTNVPSPNSGFVAVAGGFYHSLGLKADGSIRAWGDNQVGQTNVPSPNSGFVAVAGGGYHSLGTKFLRDCNANGVPDECDLASGTSPDCNSNGVPDECEADTDGDGVTDSCDACPAGCGPSDTAGRPHCDLNLDCLVNGLDIQRLVNCLTLGGPTCTGVDPDGDGLTADLDVNDDIAALVSALLTCP